jgi:hypothetical protein
VLVALNGAGWSAPPAPDPHPSGDKTLAPLPGSSFCIRGLDITSAQDRVIGRVEAARLVSAPT